MRLPVDEFNAYLRETYRRLQRQASTGATDHRAHVERQMRAMHG